MQEPDFGDYPQFRHLYWELGILCLQQPYLGDYSQLRHLDRVYGILGL